MQMVISLVLVFVALVGLLLIRLYSFVPRSELKRLSREGDDRARALYRVAAHGATARLLLWTVTVITGSIGLSMVLHNASVMVAAGVLALFFMLAWGILTSAHLTHGIMWLPVVVAPVISQLVTFLYRPLNTIARFVTRHRWQDGHTNLYDAQDMHRLFEKQASQPDNRIHQYDLELLKRALVFRTSTAKDALIPMSEVYAVNADDLIGPILLDQLYKNGQSVFLVYKDEPQNYIGTLRLQDITGAREGGRVLDYVRPEINTVEDSSPLHQVLETLRTTRHQLAVVKNEFEDVIGLVTFETILGRLFVPPVEEPVEITEDELDNSEPNTSDSTTEVIE